MSFRQFLTLLRARWILAVSAFVVAMATAVAITLLLPKQYTATASVVLDVKTPDPIAGIIFPSQSLPSYMATQVEIIESERVALRVIRTLKLTDSAAMRSRWQSETRGAGRFDLWMADVLQRSLDVKPSREADILHVSFKSADPQFSAAIANAFVQAYIDTTLELRVDPAKLYSTFFDLRAKQLRDDMEKAQTRLSEYQKSKRLMATDERLDVETARLGELSAQLVQLQGTSAESHSRQVAAAVSPDELQDVINHPVVAGLRSELARQDAKLQEMSARMGDNHPQIIELKANIAELRVKLAQETTRLSGSVGVNNVINQSRLSQLQASLEAQRNKVLELKQQRDEAAVLQREVEQSQRAYDAVAARLTQVSLESQSTQTNALQLAPATEPLKPSSPNLVLNLLVGAFVGVLLSIGLVLVRESTDRRVRSLEDITRGLRLPVIDMMVGRDSRRYGLLSMLGFGASSRRETPLRGAQPGKATPRLPALADAGGHGFDGSDPAPVDDAERSIGEIIRRERGLDDAQMEQIAAYQRDKGVRFGDAAVALGLARPQDVAYALSRQFRYPYTPNAEGTPAAARSELIVASEPFSQRAEALRAVRTQLMMTMSVRGAPRRAVALLSPDPGDGRSYFAANLAAAFSQLGGRTLLIDADMRSPRQHRIFGISNENGLSNILSGRSTKVHIQQATGLPSLFVLPVGTEPPNPLELLQQSAMLKLIDKVLTRFDHVIVDTPAFSQGMDGPVIAAACGIALIVARRGTSYYGAIEDLVATLSKTSTELAGVILNHR